MSYYNPNLYSNFPYYSPTMPQQQQSQIMQQMQQQVINGKMVDSKDVVKATEVPIGGYGIFPKADFSEVYIKTWNNNGTTSILTFKPEITTEENKNEEDVNAVLEKIGMLEDKLDILINTRNAAVPVVEPSPVTPARKELTL